VTQTTSQTLKNVMAGKLAFNLGLYPLKKPHGIEQIKLFRIYLAVLRQAELDYLSRKSPPDIKAEASNTLFGLHLSPFPWACRTLGLDVHQSRMKIIEWSMRGLCGDPVFGFLTKSEVSNNYEMGKISDFELLNETLNG
jgi:hypothetical protein